MINCRNIKKLSRKINKKDYLKSFVIITMVLVLTLLFCVIPALTKKVLANNVQVCFIILSLLTILFFILRTFFSTGEAAWYTGRIAGRKNGYKRFIFWLKPKYLFKAVRLEILLVLIKSSVTILLILPAISVFFFAVSLAFTGGIEAVIFTGLIVGGTALLASGVIFAFIFNQYFFLAKYLLAENPKLNVIQIIKQSKNLTEGQLFDIIKFKLSFLPLFTLSILIFPVIFIYPHYKQSSCIIAKELRL